MKFISKVFLQCAICCSGLGLYNQYFKLLLMCSVEYVNTSELFLGVYNSHGLSVLYAQSYESNFFYLHTTYLYNNVY